MAVAGACGHDDESNERPAGFSEQDAACSALAPAAFVREGDRIVSRALASAERRAGRGVLGAPGQLGVDVKGGFAEGLRLVSPTSPGADVTFTPLGGASRVPGRLRRDGAFVAYDDAYAGVGVALGASDRRVEEHLRIAGPAELPALRFRLQGGPAFGRWHDEGGALFAYDREGRGLFELAPPSVEDASGRSLRGRWHVVAPGEGPGERQSEGSGESSERVVEAELPWGEVVFPALVSIGFETPTWFPAGGPTPPASRAGAGLAFYAGGQGCALLFGGFDGSSTVNLRSDVVARCEGGWQLGSGSGGIAAEPKPDARQSPAMAYAPFGGANDGVYVFGGYNGGPLRDLWHLVLSGAPGGVRSATWARVEQPVPLTAANWPLARYEAGLAWSGSELLLFGGLGPGPTLFTDTWAYNGTSWRKICEGEGCFPARRSFATTVRGEGATREVLAVGGFGPLSADEFGSSSEIMRFTGTGWERVDSFEPAVDATLADGRLSPAGQSAPGPRDSPWAAGLPSGGLLLGSGIFDFDLPAEDDWNDVWRLEPRGASGRWARVPVGESLPGRRIGGSAVYDPVRGETLVVGGMSLVERTPNAPFVLNPSPPVAYRAQTGGVSMTVTCLDPGADGACDQYALEASVALESDGAPSRARLAFLRRRGAAWESAGPGCGSLDAPISPVQGNVFRCTATAALGDSALAAQAFDGAPGAGCGPGNGSPPLDDGIDAYAGTSVCRTLPIVNGEAFACD